MKLVEMLQTISDLDEQLLEIPSELAVDLKYKVDSYVKVMDHLESDVEKFKKLADFFRQKAKQREDELARLKDYTLHSMKAYEWDELKGETRKLKVVNQKRFSIYRPADGQDYDTYPFYVQKNVIVEYAWNKDELKNAFQKGEIPPEICGEKEITFIKRT